MQIQHFFDPATSTPNDAVHDGAPRVPPRQP